MLLSRVQLSPVERYSVDAPGGPSLGLKGCILFLEIGYFYFWGMNKKQRSCNGRGEGAQRPFWRVSEPKKDGCAQRTGANARPKPTSNTIANCTNNCRYAATVLSTYNWQVIYPPQTFSPKKMSSCWCFHDVTSLRVSNPQQ
jgi:hypothetical protein